MTVERLCQNSKLSSFVAELLTRSLAGRLKKGLPHKKKRRGRRRKEAKGEARCPRTSVRHSRSDELETKKRIGRDTVEQEEPELEKRRRPKGEQRRKEACREAGPGLEETKSARREKGDKEYYGTGAGTDPRRWMARCSAGSSGRIETRPGATRNTGLSTHSWADQRTRTRKRPAQARSVSQLVRVSGMAAAVEGGESQKGRNRGVYSGQDGDEAPQSGHGGHQSRPMA